MQTHSTVKGNVNDFANGYYGLPLIRIDVYCLNILKLSKANVPKFVIIMVCNFFVLVLQHLFTEVLVRWSEMLIFFVVKFIAHTL